MIIAQGVWITRVDSIGLFLYNGLYENHRAFLHREETKGLAQEDGRQEERQRISGHPRGHRREDTTIKSLLTT